MFRITNWLLAAKTSVKEVVKAKHAAKTKKKVKKVVDLTKKKFAGNKLNELVMGLPRPAKPDIADHATWLHKNGYGLKFYRSFWTRYQEPSYWTVVRYKPKNKGCPPAAWGFKTWRGVTEPLPRKIDGMSKRDWRILLEPGTKLGPSVDDCYVVPEVTPGTTKPVDYTQIPDGLKGTVEGTWPYPWGEKGWRTLAIKAAGGAPEAASTTAKPATKSS